ncbi:polysaccharide deacetylase family protein [Actinocorallia longicatena]|uniref:Polysaccharide deacetylase family protein n=1 Tax=Actinocorallia longicatena TaxID=111803 RepID=A0ABP6QK29_9ACTN
MERRRLLGMLAAGVGGLAVGAGPELWHRAGHGPAQARAATPTPSGRPDPGYAPKLTALNRPVRGLSDLSPAAPPAAVALTIDDGPHPYWTPKVLDVLAEFGVVATFNMIGEQVTEQPRIVQRIADAGHQVADHTVTHPLNLPRLSAAKITEEIVGGHDRIAQVAGLAPKTFRAPGGAWSQQIYDIAAEHHMVCVDWKIDPRDWARPGTSRITRTLLDAQAGDILLIHDGGGDRSQTVEALRQVLPALKQRGLQFVAL